MRRTLAWIVFIALAAIAVWPPGALAQQDEAGQQQKAAEFVRLWESLRKERDFEERIRLAYSALKLEPELNRWPLAVERERARAFLWWWLGLAYYSRPTGDRADNLERAIGSYDQALQILKRETAAKVWASLQINFGNAYVSRLRGDKSDNLEKAIAAYEAVLTVRTREANPREWASTQTNLGLAYRQRIRGDRGDNLEKAIAHLDAALTVYTRGANPREWASTQDDLGLAYGRRIRGDRADNLERAIAAHEAALTVRTREASPRDWGATKFGLGNAYWGRIRGDRADNLEKAIAAYEAVLTVITREASPREWALTQVGLGNGYADRVRGERADNLEKAIAAHEAALTVYTREASPRDWALTQTNLGIVYGRRILGDQADNLEKAIAAYEAVLTVWTREASPREWALTQVNLGIGHGRRIRGDRADNLEKAIAHLDAALTVYTREANPREWAQTQNNLGIPYVRRIRGDRADNLEKAIAAYEAALTVRTREANPHEWASTQANLGNAYLYRIRGDRADNLEKAIAAYEEALTVKTRDASPRDHLLTARLLGGALLEARKWREGGLAYSSAREAFLQLFGQGLNDAGARDLISEAGPLFAEAAFAAIERGELEQALALADEGRARQLRVALRRHGIELPPEKRPRFEALTVELRGWEHIAETAKGTEAMAALDQAAKLRQQLGELTAPHLPKEAGLSRDLIPEGGAIVVPVVTRFGGKLLVVTAGSERLSIGAIDLPHLNSAALDRLMRGEDRSGGWLGAHKVQQHQHERWLAAINELGPQLWGLFGAALDRGLRERGVKAGARVVLMPTAALGLLPLGLAQEPGSRRRLAETYELVHAPSLEALAAASAQRAKRQAPSLAAVINPTGDLAFTEIESALVAAHFARKPQLKLDASVATPGLVLEALKGKSYWHFASHGEFDWDDARQSGLVMRENERLTIGRLLDRRGSLGRPRLVVLSACETGLYDIDRNPDEFVGLPATFMQVGAAGVVGSLWLVDDLATSLLMAKFYDLHLGGGGLEPPTALRQAQAWVREVTRAELLAYIEAAAGEAKLDAARLAELRGALTTRHRSGGSRFAVIWRTLQEKAGPGTSGTEGTALDPGARPFHHPYYWAGFIYTGL
jgi:CHAT domain-containing protein